jgi:hypothetical protein
MCSLPTSLKPGCSSSTLLISYVNMHIFQMAFDSVSWLVSPQYPAPIPHLIILHSMHTMTLSLLFCTMSMPQDATSGPCLNWKQKTSLVLFRQLLSLWSLRQERQGNSISYKTFHSHSIYLVQYPQLIPQLTPTYTCARGVLHRLSACSFGPSP